MVAGCALVADVCHWMFKTKSTFNFLSLNTAHFLVTNNKHKEGVSTSVCMVSTCFNMPCFFNIVTLPEKLTNMITEELALYKYSIDVLQSLLSFRLIIS